MPPKIKVTKDEIINAAVSIIQNDGADAVNARNIASFLNCSTQPVFSNFDSMEQLHFEVLKKADEICSEYISKEISRGEYPIYKASGMAYIKFAIEQKALFKFLYMRSRSNKIDSKSLLDNMMENIVHSSTGLSGDKAKLFHLEMWAYVHGIASMFATDYLNLDMELVSIMLSDAYLGMRKHYGLE